MKTISTQLLMLGVLLLGSQAVMAQQISNVTPSFIPRDQTLDVHISGVNTHFGQGTPTVNTSVWFSQASGTLVVFPNTVSAHSATHMTVNVTFDNTVPIGYYHVNTINGTDGWLTLENGVLVDWAVNVGENKSLDYGLKLYPNPVINQLNVALELPSQEQVGLILYSIDGKIVHEIAPAGQNAGKVSLSIDVQQLNLPPGQYVLGVQIGSQVYTKQVLLP